MGNKSNEREDLHSSIVPAERKEQVRRNRDRFPGDFMFELTLGEKAQVAADCGLLGNVKYSNVLPYAFTGHVAIIDAIKRLMAPSVRPDVPEPPDKRRIGFQSDEQP
ncbi:MAG: ORF6N domain-containing protein [Candidatus Krumholzibacteriaceae bacterium]|jgi:hypothetical protein